MSIQDVVVTIDVQKPSPVIGLGRPVILVAGDEGVLKPTYKEYKTIEDLTIDFPVGTAANKKAAAVFLQPSRPDVVSVIQYMSGSVSDALGVFFNKSFEFVILADGAAGDRLAVSKYVEAADFKIAAHKITTQEELAQYKGMSRSILAYHTNEGEELEAALIGAVGSLTVGSVTWKNRTNLKGITPIEVDVDTLHDLGAIAYIEKNGTPRTSEGFVASGEFIDIIHGQDWVKSTMESTLQDVIANSGKIPYNDNGIAIIENAMTSVLTDATAQGIVDTNDGVAQFIVTTKPKAELTKENRLARVYDGAAFEYEPQDAIHRLKIVGTMQRTGLAPVAE